MSFASDPFERPTGIIPEVPTPIDPPVIVGGGSFDDVTYDNRGTVQPKFDLRIDQEIAGEGRILYAAGVAYTEGIIQTPIGPFDAQPGTNLAYGQIGYNRGSFRIQVFANYVQGKAPSLILVDAEGDPLHIDFTNGVYDVDVGWSDLFGGRHLMSFGGNVRYNTFDLSIAPDADNRFQAGAYIQDEINLGEFQLALAARADYFTNLNDINFSPRIALIWTHFPGHSSNSRPPGLSERHRPSRTTSISQSSAATSPSMTSIRGSRSPFPSSSTTMATRISRRRPSILSNSATLHPRRRPDQA